MKSYEDIRADLSNAIRTKMWETECNTREFSKPLKISRSTVMSILDCDGRAPRLSTIWDIAETYGYDAIGEDFIPDGREMLSYEVAHDRMCENIRRRLDQRYLPVSTFARNSGVSVETIRHIMTEDVSPNLFTLWHMADALGYDRIGDLFNYPYDR